MGEEAVRRGRAPLLGSERLGSVVFGALTPLLAVHKGFPGALSTGAGLYLAAGFLAVKMAEDRRGSG